MKDQLEEFMKHNRAAFDDQEVPEKAWKNIEKKMGFSRGSVWNSVGLWRAAAVVFMVATGYLLMPKEAAKDTKIATSDFNDVEAFYVNQISEKVDMIDEFKKREGLNGFTQDFQQLEAMYMVLKEEMKASPSEKVKDALVLNLLIRIDLLNQQLHSLEKEVRKGKKAENDVEDSAV